MQKVMTLVVLGLVVSALYACQPGPPVTGSAEMKAPVDSGLVPDGRSTGNPPLIPHEVDPADGGASCLECHKTGEMGAPIYPEWHATLVDCRQCHVPAVEGEPFKTSY